MRGVPNGVLVNGHVRKRNSMENCDLDLQEKDSDAIPTSSFHERKFSFSSCSSDGFLSSKERFVLFS
jgi:serine/threonine-protein kinase OSR1/STK39